MQMPQAPVSLALIAELDAIRVLNFPGSFLDFEIINKKSVPESLGY